MSRFDRLMAQGTAQENPVSPTVANNVPSETPVSDDLSLGQRWGQSLDYAQEGIVDTVATITGLEQEQQRTLGIPETPAPTASQAAWQLGGDTLGLVWDWGSDVLIEAGQEGIQALPSTWKQEAKDQLRELAESPVGQAGLAAWMKGEQAWNAFAAANPQEARTLSKGFDMFPGARQMKRIKYPTELTPLRIEKVGLRKTLRPPEGRDKDVYNMIIPEQTKQQKIAQVKEGRVSDPSGVSRQQSVVPTEQEWGVIDELKKTNVSANKTLVQNTNVVLKQLDKLNEQTRRRAAGTKGGVDHDTLMEEINTRLVTMAQKNPGIFGRDGQKAQRTIQDAMAQLEQMLDSNGTSWEGILRSRQEFDNWLINEMQIGTFGTGRKANAVQGAHRAIRDTMNDLVTANVPGTQDLLARQSNLFTGLDGLSIKAADEGSSALGRLLREINMHNPTTPLAQISTLLSPIVWAGAVAVSPFVLANKARRGVVQLGPVAEARGSIKTGIKDVISESQKALKMIKDPEIRKQMQADIKVLATLLHTLPQEEPNGQSESTVRATPQPPLRAAAY